MKLTMYPILELDMSDSRTGLFYPPSFSRPTNLWASVNIKKDVYKTTLQKHCNLLSVNITKSAESIWNLEFNTASHILNIYYVPVTSIISRNHHASLAERA